MVTDDDTDDTVTAQTKQGKKELHQLLLKCSANKQQPEGEPITNK